MVEIKGVIVVDASQSDGDTVMEVALYAGAEALTRGVLEALQLIPENQARLERVERDHPGYFYGSPALIVGKGYIKVPPFPLSVGNIAKGIAFLRKAVP